MTYEPLGPVPKKKPKQRPKKSRKSAKMEEPKGVKLEHLPTI